MIDIEKNLKLLDKKTSNEMVVDAIKKLLLNKKEKFRFVFILIISIIISNIVSRNINTVTMTREITNIFITVDLTIFGIIFTGFTFFEAIVTDDVLKTLACNEKNEKTYLQVHYEYFTNTIFINVFMLFVNVIISIVLLCIKKYYILFNIIKVDNAIAFILLLIFLYVNLSVIYEVKSFVFNLFQIYSISKIKKLKKMIEDGEINLDK